MRISLRQLAYFEALADSGQFGLAAERMNVTQPALSMQIKDLEGVLGAILVERLPRGVRLTAKGREVLERAQRILSDARELESGGRRASATGQIHIGIIPTVAPYLVPPLLSALDGQALAIRLREARTGQLLDDLERGRLDCAIMADGDHGPGMRALALFEDRFLLAGQVNRLEVMDRSVAALRPLALDPEELLLLEEGHCLADQALDVCELARRDLRTDLGASSLTTLCGLVAAGRGLTFLPEIALVSECDRLAGLGWRRFAAPEPQRELVLVLRSATPDEAWVPMLCDAVRKVGQELIGHAREKRL